MWPRGHEWDKGEIVKHVFELDYRSMYPSIIRRYGINCGYPVLLRKENNYEPELDHIHESASFLMFIADLFCWPLESALSVEGERTLWVAKTCATGEEKRQKVRVDGFFDGMRDPSICAKYRDLTELDGVAVELLRATNAVATVVEYGAIPEEILDECFHDEDPPRISSHGYCAPHMAELGQQSPATSRQLFKETFDRRQSLVNEGYNVLKVRHSGNHTGGRLSVESSATRQPGRQTMEHRASRQAHRSRRTGRQQSRNTSSCRNIGRTAYRPRSDICEGALCANFLVPSRTCSHTLRCSLRCM